MPVRILLLLSLLFVHACGFHLRGVQQTGQEAIDPPGSVYLQDSGGEVAREVRRMMLELSGTAPADSAAVADYVLRLGPQRLSRDLLSVSASTGKAEEFRLTLDISMNVLNKQGEILLADEQINVSRDFAFDEDAVLGTTAEEDLLREELIQRAATRIIRRLQAVTTRNR